MAIATGAAGPGPTDKLRQNEKALGSIPRHYSETVLVPGIHSGLAC